MIGENSFSSEYYGENKTLRKYLDNQKKVHYRSEPAFKAAEESSFSIDFGKDVPNKQEQLEKLIYSIASVVRAKQTLIKKQKSVRVVASDNDKARLLVEIFIQDAIYHKLGKETIALLKDKQVK